MGSILAVLCLDLALTTDLHPIQLAIGFTSRIGLGIILGLISGYAVGWLFQWRFLLGYAIEELGGMLGLALALAVYGASETLLPESGLIAVTVFGLRLGHTQFPFKHEIIAFKEQVTTVAISTAFVWLSSSVRMSDLLSILPQGAYVVAALLFLVRPMAVWLSAWGSGLPNREKGYLSLIAPRGIVAASFAFFVADSLSHANPGSGRTLVPLTFLTIIVSVLWAGFFGNPLARWFSVKKSRPQGLLIVGANPLARWIASQLTGRISQVKLIDTDPENCRKASQEGFFVYTGNPTNQKFLESLNLTDIGKLLAATEQRDTNILSCQIGGRLIGNDRVFRLDARNLGIREQEVGAETWGMPLVSIPLRASELVGQASSGNLIGEWRSQKSWWFRPMPESFPNGPWTLLAVYKGMVLFPGEGWIPRGADILEIRLKAGSLGQKPS